MKTRLYFAAFVFIFSLGCTRQNKTTTLKVQLPLGSMSVSSSSSVSSMSSGSWNTGLNPSNLSEFNCYAVFVGGAEPMMNKHACFDSAGQVKFRFGPHLIFAPAGSTLSLDVPSGPNRTITLVGLQAQNGACVNVAGSGPTFEDLSQPFILGSVQQNLSPGTQTINISRNFDDTNYFQDCNIGGSGSSGPMILYGSGAEGNQTIPASITDISSDTSVFGTRTFAAAARITNIDNSTGKVITTYLPPTASQFQPGDEVMWVVMAAFDYAGEWGGPDAVCGSGSSNTLHRGRFGFANVIATDATTITLDHPVTNYPSLINNAALGHTTPPYDAASGASFCFMQIVRVPNFDNLTFASGANIGVTPFTFVNGYGGIIAMRVKGTLTLGAASSTISVAGKGFPGVSAYYQGGGVEGEGQGLTGSYQNGGGGANGVSGGAGGGGNGGLGADGMSNPGSAGSLLAFCMSSTVCSPIMKAFMGGAGGGNTSNPGGAGGGAIYLFANQISQGSFSLLLDASGANGFTGSSGSGGGAGGNALLYANTITGTNPLTVWANGGNGGTGTYSGGGGGGGSIFLHTCNNPSVAPAYTANFGTGGTGATTGLLDANLTDSFSCGP